MNRFLQRLVLLTGVALLSVAAAGVATASAHGGPGRGYGGGRTSSSALVTEAAKQLGVARAALVSAIEKAALARIDEAVEDEDIDADDAAELKEEAQDNLRFAMALSRTRVVASNPPDLNAATNASTNGNSQVSRSANSAPSRTRSFRDFNAPAMTLQAFG